MIRVKLIVTGNVEYAQLGASLQRLYPRADVEFLPTVKVNSITSARLPAPPGSVPQTVRELAVRVYAETIKGSGDDSPRPDLVLAIDDLELANANQAQVVIQWLRLAIAETLDDECSSQRTRQRHARQLREKASFHFLAPMVEAYFFGEPAALTRAGVPAGRNPLLATPDVEDFESNEPAYLQQCVAENVLRAIAAPWYRHERHPKHYLEFLRGSRYRELAHGGPALRQLDWAQVANQANTVRFLRALLHDLADGAGHTSVAVPGDVAPETSRLQNVTTLRNI